MSKKKYKKLKKKYKNLKKQNKILCNNNIKLNRIAQEYYYYKYPHLYFYLSDIIKNRNLNKSNSAIIIEQSKDGKLSIKPVKKG